MKKIINYLKNNKVTALLITFLLVLTIFQSVSLYKKNNFIKNSLNANYQKSFFDLSNSLANIDVALSKILITDDATNLAFGANELLRECTLAKASISSLPIKDIALTNIQKFLAQTSDYVNVLSKKATDKNKISDKERKELLTLLKYADILNNSLTSIEDKILNNEITYEEALYVSGKKNEDTENMSNLEEQFENYPTLIYDGPFSDHIERKEPEMLKGKKDVTKEYALEKVRSFLGLSKNTGIKDGSSQKGKVETYSFYIKDKESTKYIDVTKKGGYIISYLDSRKTDDEKLSNTDAIMKAKDFLKSKGLNNFKDTYYDKSSGDITINFAYCENNIIMYPDLIKIKVSLKDGKILGIEAKNYIANHKERKNLIPKISKENGYQKIRLDITNVKLAVIPLPDGSEAFCYEYKGFLNKRNFLIYINALNGKTEKSLLIKESDNGILTL